MKPFKLVVRHSIPSLNVLFRMNPWQRREEKLKTQAAFLRGLESQAIADAYLTGTISREDANISATAARILALYRAMPRTKSHLKSLKLKSKPNKKNALK